MRFTTSDKPVREVLTAVTPYAIARGEQAVTENKPNGQSFHMTYRSEHGARLGLQRAQAEIPLARIASHYDYEEHT